MGLVILMLKEISDLLLYAKQPFTTDFQQMIDENIFVFDLEHHLFGHLALFPLIFIFCRRPLSQLHQLAHSTRRLVYRIYR